MRSAAALWPAALALVGMGVWPAAAGVVSVESGQETSSSDYACARWYVEGTGPAYGVVQVCGTRYDDGRTEVWAVRDTCPADPAEDCTTEYVEPDGAVDVDLDAGTASIVSTESMGGCSIGLSFAATAAESQRHDVRPSRVIDLRDDAALRFYGDETTDRTSRDASATGSVCGWPEVTDPTAETDAEIGRTDHAIAYDEVRLRPEQIRACLTTPVGPVDVGDCGPGVAQ